MLDRQTGWRCKTRQLLLVDLPCLLCLYQPLVGSIGIALYQTLIHHLPARRIGASMVRPTKDLLQTCGISSPCLVKARYRLEGVGLLRTFDRSNGGEFYYDYELLSPCSPEEFFRNEPLFAALVRQIGERRAVILRHRFLPQVLDSLDEEEDPVELTKDFNEVFGRICPLTEETEEPIIGSDHGEMNTEVVSNPGDPESPLFTHHGSSDAPSEDESSGLDSDGSQELDPPPSAGGIAGGTTGWNFYSVESEFAETDISHKVYL